MACLSLFQNPPPSEAQNTLDVSESISELAPGFLLTLLGKGHLLPALSKARYEGRLCF